MGRLWIIIRKQNPAEFVQMQKSRKKKTKQHNCRVNHTASSKAMEPMAAVHLFTESLNYNVKLSVYIGDEDSTTAAHIKQKIPYSVEKWTDTARKKDH